MQRHATLDENIRHLRENYGGWDGYRIRGSLHVVANNGPDSIGGGTPGRPLGSPFA
jgi:hypothetical protein